MNTGLRVFLVYYGVGLATVYTVASLSTKNCGLASLLCPYHTSDWRLRLHLRLQLLSNQKEAYSYQLLSD